MKLQKYKKNTILGKNLYVQFTICNGVRSWYMWGLFVWGSFFLLFEPILFFLCTFAF